MEQTQEEPKRKERAEEKEEQEVQEAAQDGLQPDSLAQTEPGPGSRLRWTGMSEGERGLPQRNCHLSSSGSLISHSTGTSCIPQ